MATVLLQEVTKKYRDVTAVDHLSLTIKDGEFLTLLGPSGCGKTTTLRMVAGLVLPTEGRIFFDKDDVTHISPEHRNTGMVFQNYVLFPHLTIEENVGFGLRERRWPRDRIKQRVNELLELVQLQNLGRRYPSELSGGQQQRGALARALAVSPRILLMDEPLGALDFKLREAMQVELKRIQSELKITTLSVTHDQREALTMSDRIAVMNEGHIEQVGAPEEIYERPATRFVANFIGMINSLEGKIRAVSAERIEIEIEEGISVQAMPQRGEWRGGRPVTVAVRPEYIKLGRPSAALSEDQGSAWNHLPGRIDRVQYSGNHSLVYVRAGERNTIIVESNPQSERFSPGEGVVLRWSLEHTLLWSREDREDREDLTTMEKKNGP